MRQKVMIIGAGASGRGHLGQLLFEEGFDNLVFVDKNESLVNQLNLNHRYDVRLLKPGQASERICEVTGIKAIYRYDEKAVIDEFLKCDIILTSVIAENLSDVSQVIAKAVQLKFALNDTKYVNIICCENLDNASSYFKQLVQEKLLEDELAFAKKFVAFPDAMISRVVPIPKGNLLKIVAEEYNEWTVNKNAIIGTRFDISSVNLIDNLPARLERKLWIHNGGHAALAYTANLKRIQYIHEALADSQTTALALAVLDELGNCIIHKHGFKEADVREYQADLGKRGAIAEMKDDVRRVIRDPIRKLGRRDRLVAPAIYAFQNKLPSNSIIQAIVNATFYESADDSESMQMTQFIQAKGFAYFVNEFMGLNDIPALAQMIIECRKASEDV